MNYRFQHTLRVLVALVWLLGAAAVPCGSAWAHEDSRAAELKTQGDALMVQEDYDGALRAYNESYRLDPLPALLYNQGRALIQLARYPEALVELERFEKEAPAELRARVPRLREMIADVRKRVSTLEVSCNVAGASVIVNNVILGTTPMSQPIRHNAGAGRLVVRAEGYLEYARELEFPGGATQRVQVRLLPKSTAGVLWVSSPVAGARVFVDGRYVGTAPAEEQLAAGKHTVVLRRDGYEEAQSTAVVEAGSRSHVRVNMARLTTPVTQRWWFWAGVGAAVVGGTALTVALLTERGGDTGTIAPGQVSVALTRF